MRFLVLNPFRLYFSEADSCYAHAKSKQWFDYCDGKNYNCCSIVLEIPQRVNIWASFLHVHDVVL